LKYDLARRLCAGALLGAALVAPSALAEQRHGTVVAIADGDTLTLLDSQRQQHRIRLDGIDAPERAQPYGQRARQSLADLAQGRSVLADCPKTDRYGRAVCRVTVDGVDVGLEQVRRGLAWHYVRYAGEQGPATRAEYANAEKLARGARSGLWSYSDPIAPWNYRRSRGPQETVTGSR
jgi:endonuclease YncB( thermonuclease family)